MWKDFAGDEIVDARHKIQHIRMKEVIP